MLNGIKFIKLYVLMICLILITFYYSTRIDFSSKIEREFSNFYYKTDLNQFIETDINDRNNRFAAEEDIEKYIENFFKNSSKANEFINFFKAIAQKNLLLVRYELLLSLVMLLPVKIIHRENPDKSMVTYFKELDCDIFDKYNDYHTGNNKIPPDLIKRIKDTGIMLPKIIAVVSIGIEIFPLINRIIIHDSIEVFPDLDYVIEHSVDFILTFGFSSKNILINLYSELIKSMFAFIFNNALYTCKGVCPEEYKMNDENCKKILYKVIEENFPGSKALVINKNNVNEPINELIKYLSEEGSKYKKERLIEFLGVVGSNAIDAVGPYICRIIRCANIPTQLYGSFVFSLLDRIHWIVVKHVEGNSAITKIQNYLKIDINEDKDKMIQNTWR
ncbi:hypothetical protein HERIO_1839 [Hepatospora eriocheir]|uniref:Uncharacterized protein n=1 Tax=Hepatospora eriocheir TaxID=1081669 RepID=A0A1X0Q8X4_9MICR|nr:hypothetical protein HERIO_1839 [Hepatospora eriocheir]